MRAEEEAMLKGGCYCGAIRYEADPPVFGQTICHCTICRGTTGAPLVAWFTVAPNDFRIVKGAPTYYRSTKEAVRGFCPTCGAQVTFKRDDLDEIDITTATLDDPNAVPPRDHIFTHSKLHWIKLADGLPQYQRDRKDR